MSARPVVSVIIPTLNEAAVIVPLLQGLQPWRARGVEIIVVDGGSSDATMALASPLADLCVACAAGRARQQNFAAAMASGELLWFVHADTVLQGTEPARLLALATDPAPLWGRFDVQLVPADWRLRCVATLMNLRSRLTGIATGDQCLFVSSALFRQVGGFPDQPLMEDVELSRRLRRRHWPRCLRGPVQASSRRWQRDGVWTTVWLMWSLRWRYFFGADPAALHRLYYRRGPGHD